MGGWGGAGSCGIGIGIFGEGWDVVWWTDWVSGLGLLMGWGDWGMGGWGDGRGDGMWDNSADMKLRGPRL